MLRVCGRHTPSTAASFASTARLQRRRGRLRPWRSTSQRANFTLARLLTPRPDAKLTPHACRCRFLASGLFKGVGPAIAKRIVAKFGADTLEVMEQGRWNELVAVKGVSKRIVKSMEEAWTASQTVKDLVIFCQVCPVWCGPSFGVACVTMVRRCARERATRSTNFPRHWHTS